MSDSERSEGGCDHEVSLDPSPIDPLSLEEALSIVGEETRASILVELGRARNRGGVEPTPLRFSELMERVGVEDSGRFNYHLDKLVGPFVENVEGGYVLRLPGQLVYQSIVAGTLTDREAIDPFPVGECPDCRGRLWAAYHPDHVLIVECGDCDTLFDAAHFPKRGIENRSGRELLEAAYQRRHHELGAMRRGVCHSCGVHVRRGLRGERIDGSEEACGIQAVLACEGCNASLVGHPAIVALTTPAVVGFFADHGRDAAVERWWDSPVAAARSSLDVVDGDTPAVAMTYELDGQRIRVVLDEDLQVDESARPDDDGCEPGF